jgi:transposase-like protein
MQLHQSGVSAKGIAKTFGVSENVVYRHLRQAGVSLTGNRSIYDESAALEMFQRGGSVKAVAAAFGVQRGTITKLLGKHGIAPRNRSEAMLLRMAQSSPEDRQRLVSAAHAAVRGRRMPEECAIRIAEGRERAKSNASADAIAIAAAIVGLGRPVTTEKAVGPYNLDIAFDELPVAVEIQGGSWHGHGGHGARLGKRREYLLSRGWHLVEIWRFSARRHREIEPMAHKLITLAQGLRLDPAGRGEHWVIDGDCQPLPVCKSYGYDVAAVPGSERRCKESGRYVSIT